MHEVQRLAEAKILPGRKVFGRWLFNRWAIYEWVDSSLAGMSSGQLRGVEVG